MSPVHARHNTSEKHVDVREPQAAAGGTPDTVAKERRETLTVRLPEDSVRALEAIVEHLSEQAGVPIPRAGVAAKLLEDAIRRRADELGVEVD